MYTVQYKEETPLTFNSVKEAIKFFDSKGWGFHNWIIKKDNIVITLEDFWSEGDKERA